MSRTIGQIRDILHGTPRWKAGLHWYDFLLAIEFHQDGTGEMMYGENQGLRSDINFRYEIAADLQIHFEFFDTIDAFWLPSRGKMFERTEGNALKIVIWLEASGRALRASRSAHERRVCARCERERITFAWMGRAATGDGVGDMFTPICWSRTRC
jgi:hypothetical protein